MEATRSSGVNARTLRQRIKTGSHFSQSHRLRQALQALRYQALAAKVRQVSASMRSSSWMVSRTPSKHRAEAIARQTLISDHLQSNDGSISQNRKTPSNFQRHFRDNSSVMSVIWHLIRATTVPWLRTLTLRQGQHSHPAAPIATLTTIVVGTI